jgi:CheY-like chemotaxis protein
LIVVAEDDPDLRETLCEALADAGYPVSSARNGREALGLVRGDRRVCLLFLDLMMPVMSGYQLHDLLVADATLASIPVVVMSANWDARRELGTTDFLRKPMSLETVLRYAARYCGGERRSV